MAPRYIVGVDEVGRGPIAGPLCVGACLMRRAHSKAFSQTLLGIRESKQLTPQKRVEWFRVLTEAAKRGECLWNTVFIGEKVIDIQGLSFALKRAVRTVLKKLKADPKLSKVLLDGGLKAPGLFSFQKTIVRGDEKEPLIAAASIVAKVRRDRYMVRLAKHYPSYGFEQHKGYGTKKHYEALKKYGISKVHRRSFLKSLVENP